MVEYQKSKIPILHNMITSRKYKFAMVNKQNDQYLNSLSYYSDPNCFRLHNSDYKALFVYDGPSDIDIDGNINPEEVFRIFVPQILKQFTIISIDAFDITTSFENEYTHFIKYTIPITDTLNYWLVYYMNRDDKSKYKYHITIKDNNSFAEHTSIYNSHFLFDYSRKINYSYVGLNCYELGFAVAEKVDFTIPSICKLCKYKTNKRLLPCTIHPSLNHKLLTECKDFATLEVNNF
jgi:hypothetical protein